MKYDLNDLAIQIKIFESLTYVRVKMVWTTDDNVILKIYDEASDMRNSHRFQSVTEAVLWLKEAA